MNENEIKIQARLMELEAANAAYCQELLRLDGMNQFLRTIIEKLIENGKN